MPIPAPGPVIDPGTATPPGQALVAGVAAQRSYTVTLDGARYERLLDHGGQVTRLRYFAGTDLNALPIVDVGPFTTNDGAEWLSPPFTIFTVGTYTPVVTTRVTADPLHLRNDVEPPVEVYALDGVIDGDLPAGSTGSAPAWAPTVDDVGEVMSARGPFTTVSKPTRAQVASLIADTANSLLAELTGGDAATATLTPLQEATARLFVTFQVASTIEASFFPEQQFGDSISDYYDRRAGAELVRLRGALGLSTTGTGATAVARAAAVPRGAFPPAQAVLADQSVYAGGYYGSGW